MNEGLIQQLSAAKEFFDRSTECLTEEDSGFAPKEGLYTTAQQVAHVAQSIDWFIDGMFNPKGFDLEFDAQIKIALDCTSLTQARSWFNKAVANGIDVIGAKTDEELQLPLADGPIMQGPRFIVVGALSDHTAHHRGALTVYSRLLGKTPKMPYGEM